MTLFKFGILELRNINRVFRHTKGPVNNVLVTRQRQYIFPETSEKPEALAPEGHNWSFPPKLEKYASTPEDNACVEVYLSHNNSDQFLDSPYISVQTMENQIKELEVSMSLDRQGSSVASEVELERLKSEQQQSAQMNQHWQRLCEELHQFCVEEIPGGSLTEGAKSPRI